MVCLIASSIKPHLGGGGGGGGVEAWTQVTRTGKLSWVSSLPNFLAFILALKLILIKVSSPIR